MTHDGQAPLCMHVCTQMDCPVCWEHTSLMMSGPKELWVHSPVYARLLTCFLVHIDPWGNRNREVGLHSVFLIALTYSMLLAFKVLSTWYCILWTHSSHRSFSNTTGGSLQNNTYFRYETFDVSEIKLIVYFFSNFLSGNVITKAHQLQMYFQNQCGRT